MYTMCECLCIGGGRGDRVGEGERGKVRERERQREGGGREREGERERERKRETSTFSLFRFAPFVEDPCCLSPGHMVFSMATCHSLTTIDGELTGDPLDLKMFNGTKWVSASHIHIHV